MRHQGLTQSLAFNPDRLAEKGLNFGSGIHKLKICSIFYPSA